MAKKYDTRFTKKYSEYNRILRTWFVAFGVGVPGALLLNTDAKSILSESSSAPIVISFFLGGAALQIFIAFLNKYVAWCNDIISDRESSEEENEKEIGRFIHSLAKLTEEIWIDLLVDMLTGVLFMVALFKLYEILL